MSVPLLISKQPVLARDESIQSYIFYYTPYESGITDNYNRVFIDTLFQVGIEKLTRGKPAFIKISRDMLFDPAVLSFPNESVILCLDDSQSVTRELIGRIDELKKLNYTFSLFHTAGSKNYIHDIVPILSYIDFFIVDTATFDHEASSSYLRQLRTFPITLIAANVSTKVSFENFATLDFTLFSGPYYMQNTMVCGDEIDEAYLSILQLLNILEQSDSVDDIAGEFTAYPDITLQLLRYLNSPAFHLRRAVKSIRHALLLIGRKELRRWLLLLAFSKSGGDNPANNPLLYNVQTRVAIMTFLVESLENVSEAIIEEAPFVAVLSMLNALIGVSEKKLFDTIRVDAKIQDAVISHKGQLGKMLELCIATENFDKERVYTLLKELGITPEDYEKAMLSGYSTE